MIAAASIKPLSNLLQKMQNRFFGDQSGANHGVEECSIFWASSQLWILR